MKNNDCHYIVTVTLNNQTPFTHAVNGKLTIGRNPRCDVVLTDKNAPENLFEINQKEESLYLKYLGPKRYAYLNNLSLEEGQNYFLDLGDRIKAKNNVFEVTDKKSNQEPNYSSQSTQNFKELGLILNDSDESKEKNTVSFENKNLAAVTSDSQKNTLKARPISQKNKSPQKSQSASLLKLLPLKIYAFIVDFFICYLLVGILLPLFVPVKFFNETSAYVLNLLKINSNSSFLYFLVFMYLINFAQSLILGSTLGQFLVGLKMDTQNKFFQMVLLRIKTFFYSLVMIPAQNSFRSTLFFKVSRYALTPLVILAILASPFFIFLSQNTSIKDISISPSVHITNYQDAQQTHQFILQRTDKTIVSSTIENRYYLIMQFGQTPKKPSSLNFIDMIEDEKINISLVRSFKYEDLNEIFALGNPFYKKSHDPIKLKDNFIYSLNNSPVTYLNNLFSHGPFTGSFNQIKKLFIPKTLANTLVINNYSTPDSFVSYDSAESRFYFIFDQLELIILKASLKNEAILKAFEEQVFGNLTKDNLFTPAQVDETQASEPKVLTLLELFKVNTSQNPAEVLTYYINAVNKVENTQVLFNQEKLNLDIKYLLVKSIESTLEVTSVYKEKQALQTLIHKLTPMETPGEQDE